ncbi:MAG: Ldh family oxidoreductase [Spirochaetaceae bacterium]|jgi:LDH2 family malate/lactate/ureidoglycolate dehydrogenase|nr:Ldh family oxidoreductase [Spirochaetaceae bacterium]
MKTIQYDELLKLTHDLLVNALGYREEEAAITARVLVEADARGIPSHGVSRLDLYQKNLRGGFAKTGVEPEIVFETPSSLVIDGHDGIGSYIADYAVQKTIHKAQHAGSAFCAVRNSNHYGIAGFWAERIAAYAMIGSAFTNTRTCAIPTFGRERVLGTNPLAIAIPEDDERCFLLDMATTTVSHGKIEVYDRRSQPMPAGWAVDAEGVGTTDATAFEKIFYENERYGGHLFLGGEGEETGGHKGFGLGLLVELLCSGLSLGMSSLETFVPGQGSGITHFFGAIRLDLFGPPDALKKHLKAILDTIRQGQKASGQARIYIHGEKEAEARERSLREGIPLDDATCALLEKLRHA